MIEFGAKLSLKDAMYATLVKNVQQMRQFQNEVNSTREALDRATNGRYNVDVETSAAQRNLDNVRENLERVRSQDVTATVGVDASQAHREADSIRETVEQLRTPAQLRIEANDTEAQHRVQALRTRMQELANRAIAPVIRLRDQASERLYHGCL